MLVVLTVKRTIDSAFVGRQAVEADFVKRVKQLDGEVLVEFASSLHNIVVEEGFDSVCAAINLAKSGRPKTNQTIPNHGNQDITAMVPSILMFGAAFCGE